MTPCKFCVPAVIRSRVYFNFDSMVVSININLVVKIATCKCAGTVAGWTSAFTMAQDEHHALIHIMWQRPVAYVKNATHKHSIYIYIAGWLIISIVCSYSMRIFVVACSVSRKEMNVMCKRGLSVQQQQQKPQKQQKTEYHR